MVDVKTCADDVLAQKAFFLLLLEIHAVGWPIAMIYLPTVGFS